MNCNKPDTEIIETNAQQEPNTEVAVSDSEPAVPPTQANPGDEKKQKNHKFLIALKKHWKKIAVAFAAVILIAGVIFGGILLSRNQTRSKLIEKLPSQLAGKIYASVDSDENSSVCNLYAFNEDGSKYSCYALYISDTGGSCFANSNFPCTFKKNLLKENIQLGFSDFIYNGDTFTLGESEFSTSAVSDVYVFLSTNENWLNTDTAVIEELKNPIKSNAGFEAISEKTYSSIAVDLLDDVKIYGLPFGELLNDCTKNIKYIGMEHQKDTNVYDFNYSCQYAPNKKELPNMYEDGELTITYHADKNTVSLSGSAYDGIEVYAILKAYSF